jgi:hypothetical protein
MIKALMMLTYSNTSNTLRHMLAADTFTPTAASLAVS